MHIHHVTNKIERSSELLHAKWCQLSIIVSPKRPFWNLMFTVIKPSLARSKCTNIYKYTLNSCILPTQVNFYELLSLAHIVIFVVPQAVVRNSQWFIK